MVKILVKNINYKCVLNFFNFAFWAIFEPLKKIELKCGPASNLKRRGQMVD